MKDKTNAKRQASYKQRMKDKGFVRKEIYVPSDRVGELNEYARQLREKSRSKEPMENF